MGDRSMHDALHVEMAALLGRHPDDTRQAELWFSMGLLATRRGEAVESERHTLRAWELAERCGAAKTAAMSQGQLGRLKRVALDIHGAQEHLKTALLWAGRIDVDDGRAKTESKLLLVSAMTLSELCQFDEARKTALAVLSHAELLGAPRLQLGALDALVSIASPLGRWDEMKRVAERALARAEAIGAEERVVLAQSHLADVAWALDDHETAMRWHEQLLPNARATGDRRVEVSSLQHLGLIQHEQGDTHTALPWHVQAQALYEALDDQNGARAAAAWATLCETLLDQQDAALSTVGQLLELLDGDPAEHPAHETIGWRWPCQQALAGWGDARAGPMLERLFADVHARATEMTDTTDRQRLIQALPVFRGIVAAHAQRDEANTAH